MLAGLRQNGNFPLPARADMNDVIAALAREAGWAVEADGTTYKQSSPAPPPPTTQFSHLDSVQQNDHNNAATVGAYPVRSVESPLSSSSLRNCSMMSSVKCQPSGMRIDESLSPASLDSTVAERGANLSNRVFASAIPTSESLESRKILWDQGLSVAGQNAQPCYNKEGFMRLVETAKPRNNPDGRHFSFFTFQQHLPLFQRATCLIESECFVERIHGTEDK